TARSAVHREVVPEAVAPELEGAIDMEVRRRLSGEGVRSREREREAARHEHDVSHGSSPDSGPKPVQDRATLPRARRPAPPGRRPSAAARAAPPMRPRRAAPARDAGPAPPA